MAHIINLLKEFCRQRREKILMSVFLSTVLMVVFLIFFALAPRNSVIYYNGSAEEVHLDMSAEMLQIVAQEDPYNGTIKFYNDSGISGPIWAIDQSLFVETSLEELEPSKYEGSQTFLFDEGTATLDCNNYLELTIEGSGGSYFTYSLSITRQDKGNGPQNYITIDNFPKDTIIHVRGESEIRMYGNVSDSHMGPGRYRIIGCSGITFPMCPKSLQFLESNENESSVSNGKVRSFQFTNIGRQTLEFTVDVSTEFKEIGHIELAGNAQNIGSVTTIISDMGEYPVSLTLTGSVVELSMAGHSFYLTGVQWLRMNMTPILLALISVIFSVIIAKPPETSN